MITVTLPDGSRREYESGVTVADVAQSIGAGLAKAALAGKVDGKLVDLSHALTADASVAIITGKDAEGLEIIRHSTSHLMAQAVKELFPTAQVTIGPAIENGFYYDFKFERAFTPEDLTAIEARMHELVKKDIPIERSEMDRDAAVKFFKDMGEHYKAEIIESIPSGEVISLYRQGDFIDLCRGPHVPSTGKLKVFKLMKVAGAYWRGDSKNEMLQRIYGTAWATAKDQDAYLEMLAEAEKRDHRRLGKELNLFHLQDEAPGMIFWHAKGWPIWQVVEQLMRRVYQENGYLEVRTPQVIDRSLWERSGHWAKYRSNMFTTESENRYYALKPMNCPGHIQLFNSALRSYRDLPLRIGEFGLCHRNEPSGSLHGMMRVRGFTQDDGHIFCTEDQILTECVAYTKLVREVYHLFGFDDIAFKVATRPEMRIGEDAVWDKAEEALFESLRQSGVEYEVLPGEGAFYGPKIEYHLKDCLGRTWQCGTIQLDFQMPLNFNLEYIDEKGERQRPIMIHRVCFGSIERFIGILTEHFAGKFPTWLAPTQVKVLTLPGTDDSFAKEVYEKLRENKIRVELDDRNEKIGYKVREARQVDRVPYMLIIGKNEIENRVVSVRSRETDQTETMTFDEFLAKINDQIKNRI